MKKSVASILMICGVSVVSAQTLSSGKKDSARVQSIEEVVVTSSYGTQKLKEEVVGSIVTLTSKDISTSQSYESIDKMISGLAPGVQIVNNSELGKPVNINIRGLGSMISLNGFSGTSTQPLIIIDGIIMREDQPFNDALFDGGTSSETLINPLARLNTDNVESINILKDAAAVALYGADSANGVILITTKKGKRGKPTYSFSTQYGTSQSINKIKYLNGEQYAQLYFDYQNNTKAGSGKPWNGVDVNWFDVLNGSGDFFRTNFTTSGGGKYFTYRVGLDYYNNNESKIMNSLEKKGIDASIAFNYKKLNISLYAAYNNLYKEQPNTYFNFILAPDRAIYDSNGNYASTGTFGIPNPLAAATQNSIYIKNNSLISSLNVSYELAKGFKISSLFGTDLSNKENTDWKSGLNESGATAKIYGKSRLSGTDGRKWNWSTHLMYEKNFLQKHHADILLGMELRRNSDFKTNHYGTDYENYGIYQNPWDGKTYTYRTLTVNNSGRSFFSQLNYDYHKKYFLSATIRRDESSAFGKDINASMNGGIGTSWLISKENFLKDNDVLNFLRLRASWGMTGNSRIGSYRSSGLYLISQNSFLDGIDIANPDSSSPPNKKLSWEKNEKLNLGLDVSLFKKIDVTVEVFRNNISNMIVSSSVPVETGYSSAEINGADMYNKGIEISLRGNWFSKKDFMWNTSINISKVKNEVTYLQGLDDAYSTTALARARKIGAPTSAIWGYEWLGVNAVNGQDIFLVDGVPTDANLFTSSPDKYKIIGDTQPDFIGGMNNMIRYKNFSLSFLINFEWGGDVLVAPELIDKYSILFNRNMSVNALDYWTGPNDTSAANHVAKNVKSVPNSTKYVYDNTHIKLQNVNINYRLPVHKIKKSFIKSASIFVDCTNVLYWYKEKSPAGKNGIREFAYLYPEMRTLSFGFKANF